VGRFEVFFQLLDGGTFSFKDYFSVNMTDKEIKIKTEKYENIEFHCAS